MKKMHVTLAASFVVIFLGVFGVINPLSWVRAEQMQLPPQHQAPQQVGPAATTGIVQPRTDLSVDYIHASQCPCLEDLGSVDAILMKGVYVVVKNNRCPGGASANASGKVKVTGFDFGTNSFKTVTKPFPAIAPGGSQTVMITAQNYLVKKSTGIKAEVIPDPPVQDCNPANNIKTVNTCNLPMVY